MFEQAPEYPGAIGPERARDFDSNGFRLRLHEWGDPQGAPLVLCHGMWDHSHGFDLLSPYLAERYRVIAIDARGHGESDWADSYTHSHDVSDIVRVLRSLGQPVRLLGHSKGGGQATNAAVLAPEHVHKLVNIEGFGPPKGAFGPPGRPAFEPDSPDTFVEFLDGRRRLTERPSLPAYPTLDDLVERRKRTNPRLSTQWLRYFVWHGARRTSAGYRFRVDPLASSGAGPFRVEWIAPGWRKLQTPMLAISGEEPDTWLSDPDTISERLAQVKQVERLQIEGAGHFPHMERPEHIARAVLDFFHA